MPLSLKSTPLPTTPKKKTNKTKTTNKVPELNKN